MGKVKRSWDMLTEEGRRESIQGTIDFFQTERGEKIGIIAAEKLLDHFLQEVGVEIYNKGIEHAVEFFKERVEILELDIEALKK